METKALSMNKLEDVFYSLKSIKSPDSDHTSYNVIKKYFNSLCGPLNLSIENGVFPDNFKLTRVTSIYKSEDSGDVSNYRPIFKFPCYS